MRAEQTEKAADGGILGTTVWISFATALLFAANSIVNLVARNAIYPTKALLQALLPNDAINLFLGVPLLIISAISVRNHRRTGFSLLAAAQLFVLYNEIAYIASIRNTFSLAMHVAIALLAAVAFVLLLTQLRNPAMLFQDAIVRRVGAYGVILVLMGLLFVVRAILGVIQQTSAGQEITAEFGVHLADLVLCSVWIVGGALLLSKSRVGQMMGLISYLNGAILFLALLAFFVVQSAIFQTEFAAMDFLVILAMSLIVWIPSVLLFRRVLAADRADKQRA